MGSTLLTVVGFTVTMVLPDLLESCVDVAVIVTITTALVPGAVNTPEEVMDPALAVQLTTLLKFPVPVTVATHWLVCVGVNVVGLQVTVTAVMDDPLLLLPFPPPQAAMASTKTRAAKIASVRI
jgi:hypothetical protein